MGKAKSPDYEGAAVAQGEANEKVVRDQTFANRPTQYTPWGSMTWDTKSVRDPASGEMVNQWTQYETLTPELQSILDKQTAIQDKRSDVAGGLVGRMEDEFGSSLDFSNLGPAGEYVRAQMTRPEELQRYQDYSDAPGMTDPSQLRGQAEDAVYNQAMSRLNPRFEGELQQMETKLRNQGLSPDDAQYKSQMQSLRQSHNDATNQALWSSNQAGRAEAGQLHGQEMGMRDQYTGEQDRMADFFNQSAGQAYNMGLGSNQQNFNQSMQSSQYATQLRQQQMTEEMQKRGFTLNEINALLSGQQVQAPQMPSFMGAEAAEAAPLYQATVDQGNFDQANAQQMMDAVSGIAGSAMSFSDRRLKTNVKRVGTVKGHPWYEFDYIWGEHGQGVMSDEIPREFVVNIGGYDAVNYGELLS